MSRPNVITLSVEELRNYYRRVADLINWIGNDVCGKEFFPNGSWMREEPNPYYCSLDITHGDEDGLVLVEYYGNPFTMATPLGGWKFPATNGENCRGWQDRLNQRAGITEVMQVVHTPGDNGGTYGPAHRILRDLEGKPFGRGVFTPGRFDVDIACGMNCSVEDVKRIWEQVRLD